MTKCEDNGFEHLWDNTTPNVIYPTYPPQFPSSERTCKNCGKREREIVVQEEIKEWQQIK